MKKYPLKLSPIAKNAIWGGNKLCSMFENHCKNVSEAWTLSTRSNDISVIENGIYSKMTLIDYLGEPEFPLLIKLIDAYSPLSVQVHPSSGRDKKTEMWYIIDAEPGAEIIYGATCNTVEYNHILNNLKKVPISSGDIIFIPAGQIHALCGGVLLCEIQENSDTTYRLYDYDRGRELHIEKALESIKHRSDEEIEMLRFAKGYEGITNCEQFKVSKHAGSAFFPVSDYFRILVCVEGEGEIICEEISYTLKFGDTYFLPKGISAVTLTGNATVLCITN